MNAADETLTRQVDAGEDGYGRLFQAFMAGALQTSLERIRATDDLPADEDRRQAWHALSYGLGVDPLWPLACELLLTLAPKLEQAGFREDWLVFLDRGMDEARTRGDRRALAELGYHAGMILRYLSRYDAAHAALAECLTITQELTMPAQRARVLNQLAYVGVEWGHYIVAEQYATETLQIEGLSLSSRATALGLLGLCAQEDMQYEDAIVFHQDALALRRELGDQRKIAWSLQNIGFAYRRLRRMDEAIPYLTEATLTLGELDDEYHFALALINLGGCYTEAGKPCKAVSPLLTSHGVLKKLDATKHLGQASVNLGLSYLLQKQPEQAVRWFEVAVDQLAQARAIGDELNAMDGLGLALMADGDYPAAADMLERALARLPEIAGQPFHYDHLSEALPEHLAQARQGAAKAAAAQA